MTTTTTRKLQALYAASGMPVEIEIGPVGVVVYAASPAMAARAAESLADAPRTLGVFVTVEAPVFERDEPAATAWIATVRFDWNRMPEAA